ncbi:hydrolase 76 protein [Myotisia sp. PD_48]|nr:hydrolase 76 protein [Myotisia sp. PD_48]
MKLNLFQNLSLWGFLLILTRLLPVAAIELNIEDDESIKNAAKIAAKGMTSYYTGHKPGDVPGNLPSPYYWWEAGAMFGALIDYWFYTGDDQWNDITIQGMMHQVSSTNNFMPPNQTMTEGNDDQAFWALAAMSAAERKFPNPPASQPQWLALVQAVFNSQVVRWDMETCGGGLKWQIFRFNRGFDYKNTISNGCFFNMAARLARYTKNDTYAEWAEKTWDWSSAIGLVSDRYQFFDGSSDLLNCTELNRIQWTYNAGVYLHGAAAMYNYTDGDEKWRRIVQGIVDGLHVFFFEKTDIMWEVACERVNTCETDQRSFKAYLSRWMAASTQLAPFITPYVMPKLRASAIAAAKACTGGRDREQCGLKWTEGKFDGDLGVGEQMSALEIFQSNLIGKMDAPVTNSTGGTSHGENGKGGGQGPPRPPASKISTADKAGAGIMTEPQVAIVTGGARGIGLAIVKDLVSKGWRVCIGDVTQSDGSAVANELGENVIFVPIDVTEYDSLSTAFIQTWKKWGRIDFVAANAGIADATNLADPVTGVSPGAPPPKPTFKTIDVDLYGVVYTVYLALHYFRQNAVPGGKIVATASSLGLYPLPSLPQYTAAKHGVVGLVRALGPYLEGQNITINCLCPGLVATGLTDDILDIVPPEKLTPVSTVIKAINRFLDGNETGCAAELSIGNIYMREQPEFPDEFQRWAVAELGGMRHEAEKKSGQ